MRLKEQEIECVLNTCMQIAHAMDIDYQISIKDILTKVSNKFQDVTMDDIRRYLTYHNINIYTKDGEEYVRL